MTTTKHTSRPPNHLRHNQFDTDLRNKTIAYEIAMANSNERGRQKSKTREPLGQLHLFKIFDFILQDDAVGSIRLLPGERDAIFGHLPPFHVCNR